MGFWSWQSQYQQCTNNLRFAIGLAKDHLPTGALLDMVFSPFYTKGYENSVECTFTVLNKEEAETKLVKFPHWH